MKNEMDGAGGYSPEVVLKKGSTTLGFSRPDACIVLTNTGHRRALIAAGETTEGSSSERREEDALLLSLCQELLLPSIGSPAEVRLLGKGHIALQPGCVNLAAFRRRLRRNPIEHLDAVVIEYTTRCNFNCAHCCNATVERRTETDLGSLREACQCLLDIGIKQFHFIGGEVSAFGVGWLNVAKHLSDNGAGIIGVLTNGWFLGQRDFIAAGVRYADECELFADWRGNGVTHVGFSIDGRSKAHDLSRGSAGLYARVLGGMKAVREAGLNPRVSLLGKAGIDTYDHYVELGREIYGEAAAMVLLDPTNIISNFIDIGNGARREGQGEYSPDTINPVLLRCAGFYRPAPHLTLKANGELATCRLVNAGEGYGNFHSRRLVDILNGMQESFIYKLHAERRIAAYLPLLDRSLFAHGFDHPCSLRAVLTMLAKKLHDEGIEPGDRERLARANREVALLSGHLRIAH